MSPSEREAWRLCRTLAMEGVAREQKKRDTRRMAMASLDKKPSGIKMGRALMGAIAEQDVKLAKELIEQGAPINMRDSTGSSVVNLLLSGGKLMEPALLAAVSKGGLVAPERGTALSVEFTKGVFKGVFSLQCRQESMRLFMRKATSWRSVKAARDAYMPQMDEPSLMRSMGSLVKLEWVPGVIEEGGKLTHEFWRTFADSVGYGSYSYSKVALGKVPGIEKFRELVADGSALSGITPQGAFSLFDDAVLHADVELLLALLDGGARPDDQWRMLVYPQGGGSVICSFLVACAAAKDREMFEAVKNFTPVVDAALHHIDSPEALACVPVSRLFELRDLGVNLAVVGPYGQSLVHVWAERDEKPRDGWASLAQRAPEVFAIKNKKGKTGVEVMADKLQGVERDEFMGSLSRIEGREIRKEISMPSKKNNVSKPRRL